MISQNAAVNPKAFTRESASTLLHGVLVYEDFATALRARKLFEQLAARLEHAAGTRSECAGDSLATTRR